MLLESELSSTLEDCPLPETSSMGARAKLRSVRSCWRLNPLLWDLLTDTTRSFVAGSDEDSVFGQVDFPGIAFGESAAAG